MALNKMLTGRKAGFTAGYVALATLIAEYTPWVKNLPRELTIPAIAAGINTVKNIIKHHFGFDPFKSE